MIVTDLKRNASNIQYSCRYHVVFCPKFRRKVLVAPIDARLETLIAELVNKHNQELEQLEIKADYVHLVLSCDPQFGIHKLIKTIKNETSHFLRQEFPELKSKLPNLWTNAYYIATVGSISNEDIEAYIKTQKGIL